MSRQLQTSPAEQRFLRTMHGREVAVISGLHSTLPSDDVAVPGVYDSIGGGQGLLDRESLLI